LVPDTFSSFLTPFLPLLVPDTFSSFYWFLTPFLPSPFLPPFSSSFSSPDTFSSPNAEPYACDCDTSTGPGGGIGVCDIFDFLCFQNAFVAGCP
jgi:hypothetical protein